MNQNLRARLERLLLGLPQWETEDNRRALLGQTLRGHAVWDHLRPEGSSAAVVRQFLDL